MGKKQELCTVHAHCSNIPKTILKLFQGVFPNSTSSILSKQNYTTGTAYHNHTSNQWLTIVPSFPCELQNKQRDAVIKGLTKPYGLHVHTLYILRTMVHVLAKISQFIDRAICCPYWICIISEILYPSLKSTNFNTRFLSLNTSP